MDRLHISIAAVAIAMAFGSTAMAQAKSRFGKLGALLVPVERRR